MTIKIQEVFIKHGRNPFFNWEWQKINTDPKLQQILMDLKDFDELEIFNFIADVCHQAKEEALIGFDDGRSFFNKGKPFSEKDKQERQELLETMNEYTKKDTASAMKWFKENVKTPVPEID